MKQLSLFIELIRLKKPIGFMLLFWPCSWGLSVAYNFENNLNLYFFYIVLFFLGSVLMRSAGCIVNDIFDKDFDKKVLRTKNRPIASGKITVKVAILYSCILCLLALLVLLNFNYFTIILALGSMPLAFTYPLMKRLTYWPQLFLGITFNYGLILGWTAVYGKIDFIPLIFYIGAIFWTLGYDTIYGYQDIKDDEIIGLKSTSIKFKNKAKQFLITCYLVLILILIIIGYMMSFSKYYYFFLIIPFIHLFIYQIKIFDHNSPENCLKAFKSNNLFGLIVLFNILIGKFI
ncbi:MAG: 4-hydroxybenzoate octaprenyltransferase [Pelagibacteraceae bacterium BACL5 MAG-120820-bin39]|jgi:4-hydroxybenzoate polyprenyltransferase|uniref:4-hydroxybenzoate octaprenyltransferase n=1 Tax=Candidatus Pelagibacter sp. TaxID=2024849 RepID=UPI0007147720|nr:MAG: 4-hydroxybenzoate octaprenyltransferase [Pelagibacteraceae bacterium BACL5 MAG-121015-bin10]KRO64263.1 MAG: 4-hydroxybenzoate octaprenyltransferase [Pelagibacteraceae bacterium BACL5 MAG-120820-bin39]